MLKYLADTNVLVEHLRGAKNAFEFLAQNNPKISSVSVAELIQGSRNKRELSEVMRMCEDLEVVSISEAIDRRALGIMERYFLTNHLQYLDALIAATSIEEKLTLVTANTKHFVFLKELQIKEWVVGSGRQ